MPLNASILVQIEERDCMISVRNAQFNAKKKKVELEILPFIYWALISELRSKFGFIMSAEVVVDALPYFDQGYDEPGVKEAVSL